METIMNEVNTISPELDEALKQELAEGTPVIATETPSEDTADVPFDS